MSSAFTKIWVKNLTAAAVCRRGIYSVALTADGRRVAAASDGHLSVFDVEGNRLWEKKFGEACLGIAVAPDGRLIAAKTEDGLTRLYDHGGLEILDLPFQSEAYSISISGGDPSVAAIVAGDEVMLFSPASDPFPMWRVYLEGASSVATNWDGSVTAVSTSDGEIFILGPRGEMERIIPVYGSFQRFAMDASGTHLAALEAEDDTLLFFNTDGHLLWSQTLEYPPLDIAVSAGGELIACGLTSSLELITREGKRLARHQMRTAIHSVAMTPDGSLIAVGGGDGKVRLLKNNRPAQVAGRWKPCPPAALLVSEIRRQYLENPHKGLCRWLDEFDRLLLSERFELNDALLEELNGGGYELDAAEAEYVKSRKAVLWLGQGITHHRAKEIEEARKCYEKAIALNKETLNLEGEDQARALLMVLDQGADVVVGELLKSFRSQLKVLGSGEALLTRRVRHASPRDTLTIIRTAKEAGYLEPLLTALESPPEAADNAAAAGASAIISLKPGADEQVLLKSLQHPDWFVRWRVAEHLNRTWEEKGASPEGLGAVAAALAVERDPDVMQELVEIIKNCGGVEHTKVLVNLLSDLDENVRYSVCVALGKVGDRSALTAFNGLRRGATILGASIEEAVAAAVKDISTRHPAPAVREVILYTGDADGADDRESASIFLQDMRVINGLLVFVGASSAIRASVVAEPEDLMFTLNIHSIPDREGDDPNQALELVDLLPEKDSRDGSVWRVPFELECPDDGWEPTEYWLEVYFDEQYIDTRSFNIVETVPVRGCTLSPENTLQDKPACPSRLFRKSTAEVFCYVDLGQSPANIRVFGKVFDSRGVLMDEDETWTAREGTQTVLLSWKTKGWKPGEYVVSVETEVDSSLFEDFVIMDEVRVTSARLLLQSGVSEVPRGVTAYSPLDNFILSVDLTPAPIGYTVAAEWFWKGHRIGDGPSAVMTKDEGEHTATFVFYKPRLGWPPGDYNVVISGTDTPPEQLSFFVRPFSHTQRSS
jgi:tetratricopeptide (TPR) repeat protein